MTGNELGDGNVAVAAGAWTTAVAAELTGAESPPAFDADSLTRIVRARSDAASTHVWLVAPAIAAQLLPALSQSSD